MAKIPLRAYLREIEVAIGEGQIDEAVAHCRHILTVFPKHTDTYRLLGKAYLEAQRYSSAADIFQRVLSAIPDDFVSHLGMSIIREDESNLDSSLWHMERAFEVQPYNPAIQGELRRLYGKRDGTDPMKARLTPGALARMYAKGNHYQQAISELRSTLSKEPNRPDLLVILAEMYEHNGESVKAIEVSSRLLKELPYCYQGNKILATLLEGTERQNDREASQQRLRAIDPYEAHTSPHAPTAKDVPDQAVTIDQLVWDGAVSIAPDGKPSWAASLGVELEKPDSSGGDLPDWLATASDDSPAPAPTNDLVPNLDNDVESLPDWMKDAGWGPASGEAMEGLDSFRFDDDVASDDQDGGTAVAAELPDWIRDMAPAATLGAAANQSVDNSNQDDVSDLEALFADKNPAQSSQDENLPDWLLGDIEETPADAPSSSEGEGIPDWLQKMDNTTAPSQEVADTELSSSEEQTPDWLEEIEAESLSTGEADRSGDIPDWLHGLDSESGASFEDITSESTSQSTGVTDFLKGLEKPSPESPVKEPAAEVAADADDGLPDWLNELADTQETVLDKPITETADEGFPDWLNDLDETPETPTIQPVTEMAAAPADAEDGLPDWLNELADTHETILDEPVAEADDDDAGLPDWLNNLDKAPEAAIEEPVAEMASTPSEDDDGLPDWLNELADTAETTLDEPVAEADDDAGFPDWLSDIDETPEAAVEVPVAEVSAASTDDEEDGLPDWLNELTSDIPVEELLAQAQSPEEVQAGSPDWLAELAQDDKIAGLNAEPDFPEWLTQPDQEKTTAEPTPKESVEEVEPAFPEWLSPSTDEPISEEESAQPILETPEIEDGTDMDFADADAAMAWLESLAAKQGVPEEELLSTPEERSETPPEWIRSLSEESQPPATTDELPTERAKSTVEDFPDWLKDSANAEAIPVEELLPEAEVQPAEEILGPEESQQELGVDTDMPDWLKTMETAPSIEIPDSTEQDTIPDWLAGIGTESSPKPGADAEAETGWLDFDEEEVDSDEASGVESEAETVEIPAATEEGEMPGWLKAVSADMPEDQPGTDDELPTWLRGVDDVADEDATWIRKFDGELPQMETESLPEIDEVSTEVEAEEREVDESPRKDIDDYIWQPAVDEAAEGDSFKKLDLNTASLVELERLPGMGFRRAQLIFSHREAYGSFSSFEELQQIEGFDAETVNGLQEFIEIKAVSVEPTSTPASVKPDATILADVVPEDEHHAKQIQAQQALAQGQISDAISTYEKLLKKGKRVDAIIADLEQASQNNPMNPEMAQVLGDAYMRSGKLQNALEQYSKAEKLLQMK